MKIAIFIAVLVSAASAFEINWADGTQAKTKSAWAFPGYNPNDRLALLRDFIEQHLAKQRLFGSPSQKAGGNSNSSSGGLGDKMDACWKDTIAREPHPPNYCPPGQEEHIGYCYDDCKPGYSSVGPVCWEDCRPTYEETLGGICNRDMLTVEADNSACPFYDRCGLISNHGCTVCPPPPPGYPEFRNDGCQCRVNPDYYTKDTYIRDAHWPTCEPNEVFESGFCLDECPKKYYPVGPTCWQECPKSRPHDAGALCCKDEQGCTDFIIQMSKASVQLVAAAVEHGFDLVETEELVQQMIQTASTFAFFKCTKYTVGK